MRMRTVFRLGAWPLARSPTQRKKGSENTMRKASSVTGETPKGNASLTKMAFMPKPSAAPTASSSPVVWAWDGVARNGGVVCMRGGDWFLRNAPSM